MTTCEIPDCHRPCYGNYRFCARHTGTIGSQLQADLTAEIDKTETAKLAPQLAVLYPKYYKAVPKNWKFMDTYAVNILFPVDDPSGCILHARKKLLVPGVRSGGKSMRKDIAEARDTLNRWLELNPE